MDITEFVVGEGFGWYYLFNIPWMFYEYIVPAFGVDLTATWQIVTIEENSDLPTRFLELQIGQEYSGSGEIILEMNREGVRTKSTGTVGGQFMYTMIGANLHSEHPVDIHRYDLRYIVDGVERFLYPLIEEGSESYRTREISQINASTRNGVPINNIMRFSDRIENHPDFLNFPVMIGDGFHRIRNRLRWRKSGINRF